MKKILSLISILVIAFTANLLFTFSAVYAETTSAAGVSNLAKATTTQNNGRVPIKPVIKQVKFSTKKASAGAATTVVKGEKKENTRRMKKRKPFDLGFDVKPYLAIVALIFVVAKTGYAKSSLSPLRNRISW